MVLSQLSVLLQAWQTQYSDAPVLQTAVSFVHLGGLLLGGGVAVATDTATLRAARASRAERTRRLADLQRAHLVVLSGLAAIIVSGLLIFAADLETYLTSPIYWIKMGIVALLLANGFFMHRAGRAMSSSGDDIDRAWVRLRRSALTSYALWFASVLAGAALVNLG